MPIDGFDACVTRMTEILEVVPQPIMRWTLRFTEMPRALLAGRLDAADALAMQAFEASGASADGLTIFGAQISNLRWEQGRLHELVDLRLRGALDRFRKTRVGDCNPFDEAIDWMSRAVARAPGVPLFRVHAEDGAVRQANRVQVRGEAQRPPAQLNSLELEAYVPVDT